MSRAAQAFKQTDVSKAIRGARNAQLAFDRVEIDKAGKITIHVAKPGDPAPVVGTEHNEWDDVK
jgi:hypothetical protein